MFPFHTTFSSKRLLRILLPCTITIFLLLLLNQMKIQNELASAFVRLHIIAASDGAVDQNHKLAVRNSIISYLSSDLEKAQNKEESVEILQTNLQEIQYLAQNTLEELGDLHEVTVSLAPALFPQRTYGSVTLPAGTYDALNITIGEGNGHNWWCILFPPLCFQDITTNNLSEESDTQIGSLISEDAYDSIHSSPRPKIRFYFLDFLNFLFE